MRVAHVSYFYDRDLPTPEALLRRYDTLTGWVDGLTAAGADVVVVQRFGQDAEHRQGSASYTFVRDPTCRPGSLIDAAQRVNRTVVRMRPDIVHVHGLMFARQAARLKRLQPQTPILLQDHASAPPVHSLRRITLRAALRQIDAVSFAALEQADPWVVSGLLPATTPVFALMEGSSRFDLRSREEARAITECTGDPVCLWVGRLNTNKDPVTVLRGFADVVSRLPDAQFVMVYDEAPLLSEVKSWLAQHPTVAARVTLLGRLPHADLEAIYNSADFFLLGSHHEGSGYAALEALSCGVVPILTDIPSFRVLVGQGEVGGLWPVGDAGAMAQTLLIWQARRTPETPKAVRRYFENHWSFESICRQAMEAYRQMIESTRMKDEG